MLPTYGHIVRDAELFIAGGHRVTIDAQRPNDLDALVRVEVDGQPTERLEWGAAHPETRRLEYDLCDRTGTVRGLIGLERAANVGGRFSGARFTRVHLEPCA